MYKYYNKNDYNIMYYHFDSISEFIDYIDNAKLSAGFRGASLDSEASDSGWYKTSNLAEAKQLAKYGYHENFDKFVELKLKLEKYIKLSSKKSKQFNYYIGYVPDVKAYLEGNPLSMLNKINPTRKQVDIYYNSANLGGVGSSQIFNRGVITLSLVEVLEKLGFSVNLNIFTMSSCNNQIHYAVFKLKDANERLNVQKLFFPMSHPSWFRRLVFKLKEVTPDITSSWTGGYGRTCDEDTIRKIIDLKPNDIVICRPDEMGVYGDDLIDDANNMFEHINRNRETKDFELPSFEKTRRM